MNVMKSIVNCGNCQEKTTHYKKDAGPWFYQVCKQCGKETLLENGIWDEFYKKRIDDIRKRSGLN